MLSEKVSASTLQVKIYLCTQLQDITSQKIEIFILPQQYHITKSLHITITTFQLNS